MGHYCRICGRTRPNEELSGKGHRTHAGKDRARMPKSNRDAIEREEEIFNYLKQSHISAKNTARPGQLVASPDPRIAELATIVIEVAEVQPFNKRRLQILAREQRSAWCPGEDGVDRCAPWLDQGWRQTPGNPTYAFQPPFYLILLHHPETATTRWPSSRFRRAG